MEMGKNRKEENAVECEEKDGICWRIRERNREMVGNTKKGNGGDYEGGEKWWRIRGRIVEMEENAKKELNDGESWKEEGMVDNTKEGSGEEYAEKK